MIDLKINKYGEKVVAEYLLKSNDRIDNLTLGMMVHNDIKGYVPVTPVQADNNRYFKYDITGLVSIKEYLGGFVKKEQLLSAFYSIATTIRDSAEYMINWTSFSLDVNEVFVDKEKMECKLICMPLLTVVNDGNLSNFFKMILFTTQFDTSENNDYIGSLMNFLNPSTFALDKFIYNLEEMLDIKHPEKDEEDNKEESIADIKAEKEKKEDKSEEKSAEKPEDKSADKPEDKPEEKSADESEDKSEEGSAEKSEEISESEAVENNDEEDVLAVPVMTKEELETAEVEKNVSTETEVKTLSPIEELMGVNIVKEEQSKEESEEKQESSEETQSEENEAEEGSEEVNVENLPYLQKTRHGDDKIPITKDIFYVGKAKDVDYQILDDPMIEDKPAYIIRHGEDYFLVDMNSPMGTYMNGTMIPVEKEVLINDGARIKFGEYDYIFKLNK